MELTKNWQKIGEVVIGNAGYGNIFLRLYARYISHSTEDNSSPVQVELRHYLPSSYSHITYYSSSQKITGDIEKSSTNSTNKVCSAGETVLLTETKTIEHNEDGSKTISVGASFTNSYFGNTVTIEQLSVDLPKIDRLNQIVVNDGTVFNVDTNENVSNEIPVSITKYVDSYNSKLKITMENNLGEQTLVRDYADFDSDILIFTEDELNTIYNNTPTFKLLALIFDLDSYDAETKIGTYTVRQTATLSETDLYPTFTDFEYADINDITTKLTDNPQILIKGYSDVEIAVSEANKAIGRKGASIKQYTFANGSQTEDKTASSYPITAKFKNRVQDKSLTVTAIDSRGLPANVVKDLTNMKVSKESVIEWTGDLTDKEQIDIFYRVSSEVFTPEQLIGQMFELTTGEGVIEMEIERCQGDDSYFLAYPAEATMGVIAVVRQTTDEIPFPTGTYFLAHFMMGYVSKLTVNIDKIYNNWIEYTDIEKKPFSAERKNAGTSTQVTLKLSGNIWDGNFGKEDNKIISAIYKYKKTTDGEDKWVKGTTTLNVVKDGSSYSLEQDIAGDLGATGFDQEESYDIYVEVSDQLSTVSDTFTLGVGSPGIARYKNCVALGAPYDESLGGRVQIPKVTGETDFVTNLKKAGKEVATKEDIPIGWEDITNKDDEIITYASNITFTYKKMYRILNKFIYFACGGTCSSASTAITIGNITENNIPPIPTYVGGCGPESKAITICAGTDGKLIARLPSNGTWFGFSIMWAIDE